MKLNRLVGVFTLLMQNGKMTAPELAERFEVSRRTIQRDIEDLCMAGIPIVTTQGGDGGISLAEGFHLDSRLLNAEELQNVLTGLKGLGSISDAQKINRLIRKLSPADENHTGRDDLVIDLASHYKSSLSEKIALLREALTQKHLVSFDYYSSSGKSVRRVEPYLITYKWAGWYVLGFCLEAQDFRLFKLNRLWNLQISEECFSPRPVPESKMGQTFEDRYQVTLLFEPSAQYLLIEEYGPSSYTVEADGRLKATISYDNAEYILSWILSFGDRVKVLSPSEMVEKHCEAARKILLAYEHDK
jgi:predicted DNA-binding transcriptional regulator YafY